MRRGERGTGAAEEAAKGYDGEDYSDYSEWVGDGAAEGGSAG